MNLFNYSYIQEITNNNKELEIEIISVIIATLPAVVFELDSQANILNFETVSLLAHKLKSTCKMLSMNKTLESILFLEESDLNLFPKEEVIESIHTVTSDFNEVLNQLSLDLDDLE